MSDKTEKIEEMIEYGDDAKSVLAALPTKEWVKVVGFFALAKIHLLKTRGGLCANILIWIKLGLTVDDARRIFQQLCHPEIAQRHNFENQLMCDLECRVWEAIKRRRQVEERRLRKAAEEQQGVAAKVLSFADAATKRFNDEINSGRTQAPPLRKGRRA